MIVINCNSIQTVCFPIHIFNDVFFDVKRHLNMFLLNDSLINIHDPFSRTAAETISFSLLCHIVCFHIDRSPFVLAL